MVSFLFIIAVVATGLFVWTIWFEPRWFRLSRYTVQIPNLNAPIKAVVIGDLQPNTLHWPERRLERVFSDVSRSETPDIVLWLGDYYNGHTGASGDFLKKRPRIRLWAEGRLVSMNKIAQAMSKLSGRIGSFAVLGNHDWAWSGEETEASLERVGVQVLKDNVIDVVDEKAGQKLQIVGYEDVSSFRMPAYAEVHAQLDPAAAQIALSHSPDAFDAALGGPSLMLAGHTHGGQVRFPFVGALVVPLRNKAYDRGWFSDRHRRLYVTTGLGSSLPPLRFMCRPEIVILNLEPLKPRQGERDDKT